LDFQPVSLSNQVQPMKAMSLLLLSIAFAPSAFAADDSFQSLFDGHSLNGWGAADMSCWSVEHGAITGKITVQHPLKNNLYLIWRGGELADFELKLKSRVFGSKGINNGFQFRSRELPNHDVAGYQVDNNLDTDWLVRLYDEHGRETLAWRGQRTVFDSSGKARHTEIPEARGTPWFRLEEWHEYHLICEGSHLTLKVDGRLAAEVIDNDPRQQDFAGILALQLHTGTPPITAQFKDIRLRLPSDHTAAGSPPQRQKTSGVPRRPFIHYRPATGNLGDTIAFFWKGDYHVFYLHEGRWDHLVTADLIHWRELPPALLKGDDPLGPDGEACWTGSIVEHAGTFHLFYTGKNMRDPAGDQKVMMATSKDLIRWAKQPGRTLYADGKLYWSKPVNGPADSVPYHHQAFRDPDVFWLEHEKQWWMILHALAVDGLKPCIGVYTSPDLLQWTPRAPLARYSTDWSLDCPHAAPTQGRWFILAADTMYATTQTPDGPYPPDMTPYESGDLFVPKSLFDGKRRILWGWVRDLEGACDGGKGLWGGTMSMAREIFADERGRLCSRPPAEVTAAFTHTILDLSTRPALSGATSDWRYEGSGLACPQNGGECRLDAPAGYMLQCAVRLDPSAEFAMTMRQQDASDAGYRLVLRPKGQRAELQRGPSHFGRPVELDTSKPITIQAFVQDSIIECFINARHAFTCRAYDYRQGKLGFRITAGAAHILDLKIRTSEAPQ
jgi:beta-fructofuranosidase